MRWQKKSYLVLVLSLIIALAVWSQMGMYVAHHVFGFNLNMNFFKFCLSLFREDSFYYFIVFYLLNALIAYTVLITVFKVIQQYAVSSRFKKKILTMRNDRLTDTVIREFKPANPNLIVIEHEQSMAFTMGFRRPIIVLSSGLISMLDRDELEAVVEHETFHQKNYDAMKIFILQLISQSLWYIPLTKWSYQNLKIISELLADEYAIHRTGSELWLSSALLKLIRNCFSKDIRPVLTHFSDGDINYRLQQLVDPQSHIPVKLQTASILISLYVLILYMSMIALAIT